MPNKYTPIFLIFLSTILAACNLNSIPSIGVVTPTLPSSKATVTLLSASPTTPPTQASTPTFPPVITATSLPPTVTPTKSITLIATKAISVRVTEIKMSSLSVGWAIGQIGSTKADEILRTADGGKSWKAVTPPEGDRSEKKAIAFFQDANRAWATFAIPPSGSPPDSFMVWRTTDGGTSWKSTLTSLAGMTMESFTVSQIAFFDASNGWLWAVNGVGMSHTYIMIYKTIDGGTTWKQVVSPDKNNLNMACSKSGVWFRDAQHGYISGNCGGVVKGLYFYKTDNGGDTWSLVTLPAPAGLPDAYSRDTNVCGADTPRFFDMQKGYILVTCRDMDASKNYRWVYSTTNGGGTWNASALPRPWGDIFFLNAETGWYLGQTASDDYSGVKVYLTLDGGKNWKEISGTQWAGRMEYLDTKNGWVIAKAASDTALVRTFDGGLTYQLINPQLAP